MFLQGNMEQQLYLTSLLDIVFPTLRGIYPVEEASSGVFEYSNYNTICCGVVVIFVFSCQFIAIHVIFDECTWLIF